MCRLYKKNEKKNEIFLKIFHYIFSYFLLYVLDFDFPWSACVIWQGLEGAAVGYPELVYDQTLRREDE